MPGRTPRLALHGCTQSAGKRLGSHGGGCGPSPQALRKGSCADIITLRGQGRRRDLFLYTKWYSRSGGSEQRGSEEQVGSGWAAG